MKMDFLSRRDFAKSAAFAAVGANAAFAQSREIPVLRIGILSDLHYRTFDNGKGLQNCLGIESTLRYLDRRKVDGVVACGDITDFGIHRLTAFQKSLYSSNAARLLLLGASFQRYDELLPSLRGKRIRS